MRNKKIAIIIVIVFSMVALFTLTASATPAWYYCTVEMAGPGGSTSVNVKLTESEGAFTSVWFRATGGQQDRLLATALTAFSIGKRVLALVDKDGATLVERELYAMYVTE